MQFNFLGGQSRRDTLQDALGQRNQVLDAQLDFSKTAFATGVQGVGATMRQAMQIGQQENEAVRRDKTTIREGALQRQQAQELLSQKLEADDVMFERTSEREDARTKAANEARRLEILGQEGRANRAQLEKEARDNAEFERRRKLGLGDAETARKAAEATNKGKVAGFKAKFDALYPTIKDKDVAERFKSMFDKMYTAIEAEKDPDKFAGMLSSLQGMLDPKELNAFVRGIGGPAEEEKPKPAVSNSGNSTTAPAPKNRKAKAAEAPAAGPTSEIRALNPEELTAAQGVLRALEGANAPMPTREVRALNPDELSAAQGVLRALEGVKSP